MNVSVVQIGNSKGIRLSKTLIEKYNIKDTLEMILESGYIILKPISEPRKDWAKAFENMHKNGDDRMLMNDVFVDEDFEEWK